MTKRGNEEVVCELRDGEGRNDRTGLNEVSECPC